MPTKICDVIISSWRSLSILGEATTTAATPTIYYPCLDEKPRVLASGKSTPPSQTSNPTSQNTSQRIGLGCFLSEIWRMPGIFCHFKSFYSLGPFNKQCTPVQQNKHSQRVTVRTQSKKTKRTNDVYWRLHSRELTYPTKREVRKIIDSKVPFFGGNVILPWRVREPHDIFLSGRCGGWMAPSSCWHSSEIQLSLNRWGGREFYRQLQLVRVTHPKSNMRMEKTTTTGSWWFQPIWKDISEIGSFPQLEVNIKKMKPPPK